MNLEQKHPIENKEKYTSKIELHFFRHSIKEGVDAGARLSSVGRKLAIEKSYENVNLDQAVAFGSPRIRAQETAGFVMAGSEKDITGDETIEELKSKLNVSREYGSKIGVDTRLDFNDDPESPLGKMLYEAMKRGEYVKFLVEESDSISKETGDSTNSNYTYKAGQIAQIIEKYIKISPRWNELVANKEKKYTTTLERYFGTHQGACESFIAKVIEKTEGLESRSAFINAIDFQGFDYVEGFDISVVTSSVQKLAVKIKFKKDLKDGSTYSFEHEITPDLIQEIVNEGK